MKKTLVALTAMSVMVAGCSTTRGDVGDTARGALIGAAGGAAISAVTGGDVVEGAAIGGAAGAVIGYITRDGKRREVYRDNRGNRYWIDDDGRRRGY